MPWYTHAATFADPDTGLFSEDLKGLATNPASMAAGDAGAPKIALPSLYGAGASVTFTDLDDFSGLSFQVVAGDKSSISDTFIILEYSINNGSSWSATFNMAGLAGGNDGPTAISGTFDFASGVANWVGTRSLGNASAVGTVTATGASVAINAVRFTNLQTSGGAIIYPNGGII